MITEELLEALCYEECDLIAKGTVTRNWTKVVYSHKGEAFTFVIRRWEHPVIPVSMHDGVVTINCENGKRGGFVIEAETIEEIEETLYSFIDVI